MINVKMGFIIQRHEVSGLVALLGLVLLLLLSGCAKQVVTYRDSKQLQPGYGWLAMPVHSPNPEITIEFVAGAKAFHSPKFPYGNTISLMQLPVGGYYIGAIYAQQAKFTFYHPESKDNYYFEVRPDVINYFGDLYLDGNTISLKGEGAAFIKTIQKLYPDLLAQHALKYTGIQP